MEKIITLNLSERKARRLAENLVLIMRDLDELYEKTGYQGTKDNSDEMEEIHKDLTDQIFSEP
jgi:hypothetical protein